MTIAERVHANCTECSICGKGWDAKLKREVPNVHPQSEAH